MDKPVVLLVDDNEATVTLVTALLQREFAVEAATDGNDAIEKLRVKQYAAILLDLRMPHLDGFGVLEFLSENNPDMLPRVLVVTGALSRAETARAKSYKVCDVIAKPFDIDALLSAVRECVGAHTPGSGPLFSSGMLLLLADMLRQRFM